MTTTLNRNLLSFTMNCPLCGTSSLMFNEYKGFCKHDASLVADITTHEVKSAIREVIDAKNSMVGINIFTT